MASLRDALAASGVAETAKQPHRQVNVPLTRNNDLPYGFSCPSILSRTRLGPTIRTILLGDGDEVVLGSKKEGAVGDGWRGHANFADGVDR